MSVTESLINAPGPLPITSTFNAEGEGPVIFFLSGSGWSDTGGGTKIGITAYLDGEQLGVSVAWTNEASSHKTLVPIFLPAKLTQGEHTLKLEAFPGTNTDVNDFFTVTLFY